MSILGKNISICDGFSGMILLSGLTVLVLTNSLHFTSSLWIASFIWLIAWLLASQSFYSQVTNPEPFLIQIYPLLLVTFGYLVTWFSFMALSYATSIFVTLCIYGVGILFLVGVIYSPRDRLRARMADDLFFINLILTGFILLKSFLSPQEITSATMLGVIINLFQNLISPSFEFTQNIFTALKNKTTIEYYIYSIILLQVVFFSTKDIPNSRRVIPAVMFWWGAFLLEVGIIFLSVFQLFAAVLMDNGRYLFSANTIINIFIITIGLYFLLHVRSPYQSAVTSEV